MLHQVKNSQRKGIILAGGAGSRLSPNTKVLSKHLLPIFDKPMIYYPLTTLMLAGIREILIITTPEHLILFKSLLGDGSKWGIKLKYISQKAPEGIAQAFQIAEKFLEDSPSALILGDNIFYANDLVEMLNRADQLEAGATIFAYRVKDPERFGIINFDSKNNPLSIEEKPKKPSSNYAITGLYFYDNTVCDLAKDLKPSARGELEITDLNEIYLNQGKLSVELLGRGVAWLDTGTHEALLDAGNFIATVQKRQGLLIACPEEIALSKNWITAQDVLKLTTEIKNKEYREHLKNVVQNQEKI